MTKLIPTVVFVTLISSPTLASRMDRHLFSNCIYNGGTIAECADTILTYHNEPTPHGTAIFRGQINPIFRPQIEETENGVTIFRGR